MNESVEKKTVKVVIFGESYFLKSEKSPEYVEEIAKYVNDKIESIAKQTSVSSQIRIAVLAALNIAEEFLDLKQVIDGNNQRIEIIEARSKDICDKIDYHLTDFSETTK